MQSPPTSPNEPPGGWGVHLPPGVDPKQEAQAAGTGGGDSGAMASLALGVISAPLSFCCGALAIVANLIGLVLAFVAIQKSSREGGGNRTLAIAALIVNGLVLVLNVGLMGFFAYGAFGSRLFP